MPENFSIVEEKQPEKTNENKIPPPLNKLLIVLVSIVILGCLGFAYAIFRNFTLNRDLKDVQQEINFLKTKNNDQEKELIFYKNTDLAKELELVNLKLDTTDEKLKETQDKLSATEQNLESLKSEVSNVPQITETISLMTATLAKEPGKCFSEEDKKEIEKELDLLGDSKWKQLWNDFASNTTSANCSHSPNLFTSTINYGLSKISDIAK